jgi:large subunit ribosomal protein L21
MATEGKKTTKKATTNSKSIVKKATSSVKKADKKIEKTAEKTVEKVKETGKEVEKTAEKSVAKVKKTGEKVETKAKKTVSKAEEDIKKVTSGKDDSKFAVIKLGGTQLKISEGDKYEVEKIEGNKGDEIEITDVLMVVNGDKVQVGTPTVKGAKVTLLIDSQKKDKKIRVFKYKAKSRYRKTQGHRGLITRILVKEIKG